MTNEFGLSEEKINNITTDRFLKFAYVRGLPVTDDPDESFSALIKQIIMLGRGLVDDEKEVVSHAVGNCFIMICVLAAHYGLTVEECLSDLINDAPEQYIECDCCGGEIHPDETVEPDLFDAPAPKDYTLEEAVAESQRISEELKKETV